MIRKVFILVLEGARFLSFLTFRDFIPRDFFLIRSYTNSTYLGVPVVLLIGFRVGVPIVISIIYPGFGLGYFL